MGPQGTLATRYAMANDSYASHAEPAAREIPDAGLLEKIAEKDALSGII
jgi:hypothetical protein